MPGYEAPVNLAMSQRNRSAAARIPMYSDSPNAKRVEFRCQDPTANAYVIETWLEYKWKHEVDPVRLRRTRGSSISTSMPETRGGTSCAQKKSEPLGSLRATQCEWT